MFRSFDPDDNLSRLSGVYQGTGTGTPLATFAYASNGLVSSHSEGTGVSGASYGITVTVHSIRSRPRSHKPR